MKKDISMRLSVIWQAVIGILLIVLLVPIVKLTYFNAGLRWQYILVFSFIATYFLTPFCRTIALKRNILDHPDWRKRHQDPTPLLGGLAVFLAFSFSLIVNGVFLPGMKSLVVGSLLIFVLGLWDDIHSISALLRFAFQILISIFVILSGGIYRLYPSLPTAKSCVKT